MATILQTADPLAILPPEIVLQILDFASISTVASLTAVSQAWHRFIDITYQDSIYSSTSKTTQPVDRPRDLPFICSNTHTVSRWFDDTSSWKDLCKRQTLLSRNWAACQPATHESVLQVGNDPVWRFRVDLKRRFVISTSHAGGLTTTDIDTGRILWKIPSTLDVDEEDAVKPYAHLEYQDGMAVFDREGNAVEVWEAVEGERGRFQRIAVLDHAVQTRGFQLSYGTLCVVSTEGQGFVYDMTVRPPKRISHLMIEDDAVGHLDQSAVVVVYSMGKRGYHVYDKREGAFLGVLQPSACTEKYHISPPAAVPVRPRTGVAGLGLTAQLFPSGPSMNEKLTSIQVAKGPLPPPSDLQHVRYGEDEWGAGMLSGDLFVGVSRAGRVFVCSDWRKALRDPPKSVAEHSAVIECESDGSTFDLGGWLSVRNHRIMFEIKDRIYVVALDDQNKIQDTDPVRASYSLLTCTAPRLAVPVSFMALFDDAILTTYTTLGRRLSVPDPPNAIAEQGPARMFPTKAIRIVCLAPDPSKAKSPRDSGIASGPSSLWNPGQQFLSVGNGSHSQAGLLQLLSVLRDELGEPDDEDSDAQWGDESEHEEHA